MVFAAYNSVGGVQVGARVGGGRGGHSGHNPVSLFLGRAEILGHAYDARLVYRKSRMIYLVSSFAVNGTRISMINIYNNTTPLVMVGAFACLCEEGEERRREETID